MRTKIQTDEKKKQKKIVEALHDLPAQWQRMSINEVFDTPLLLNALASFIDNQHWAELRLWLNTDVMKKHLESKNLFPDYLYYYLEHKFKTQ